MILAMIAIMLGSEFSGGALFLHITDSQLSPLRSEDTQRILTYTDPGTDVFRDIINGDVVEGVKLSKELEKKYADSGSGVLGHTEGVFASLVGTVTSGHLYIKILQAIFTITKSPRLSIVLFVILAALVYSAFFALIREPYTVIIRRMFLEARIYDNIPFHHVFHLKHARRWIRASLCVIYADFLYALWFFTIAGAFIKRYSYYLVPYIVAENPDIKPKEALALSVAMMKGHKMECFKFELTFFGWLVLGLVTGGFSNALFYAPYKLSAMTEYYVLVRADAKAREIPGTDMLDDDYLIEKADGETLKKAYSDLDEENKNLDSYELKLTGYRRFFAENLAVWLGGLKSKEEYQKVENRKFQLSGDMDAAYGRAYPDRLNPRLREYPMLKRLHTDFLRCYTLWNLFLMFFIFAFIGWIWEVIVFMIETGEFVNRGSLYGPWVPIYGAGGTVILVVLCKLRTRPSIMFFAIAVLCGIMEYATSYIQEMVTGMRYWDYSGYFLNLDGRICAEGLFAFAALGSIAIYFIAPRLDDLLMKIDHKLLITVTISLMILFIADVIYSHFHPHQGKGITDMGRVEPLTLQQHARTGSPLGVSAGSEPEASS